ncbi:MAG: Rrf2 family transcriptional regulator [Alphaproteobacteria bacterium]|nr:Rrf2 family transcriptional regulator [Alphaproteobacteria bacterium]
MANSTKLASAAYIMAYVARHEPEHVTTESIARVLRDHPARVRQIVAALVKAGLMKSLRGATGGIVLARPPAKIDFREIYEAIGDKSPLSLAMREDDPGRNYPCNVHPVISRLYRDMESDLLQRLSRLTLDKVIDRRPT